MPRTRAPGGAGLRYRLPELLDEHGVTAYGLARDSGGRVLYNTLNSLVNRKGRTRMLDGVLVRALMDMLGVDMAAVVEPDAPARRRAARGAR